MNNPDKPNKPKDFRLTVIRTISGHCPNCGKGSLFASYLKPVELCAVCGEALGHIRADDGPAWLTILIIGHIFAFSLLGFSLDSNWPDWAIMAVVIPLILILTLAILPRAKGFFIGVIWCSGCIGAEK